MAEEIIAGGDPPLGNEAIEEFLLHIYSDKELLDQARRALNATHFSYNSMHQSIWIAATSLAAQEHLGFPFDEAMVRSQISEYLEKSDCVADEVTSVFGDDIPKWAKKRFSGIGTYEVTEVSFLRRLRDFRESASDPNRGQSLLRRLVYERGIAAALREDLCVPFLPDPAILRKEIESRFDVYDRLSRQHSTFGDSWEKNSQDLKKFRGRRLIGLQTGLSRLDQYTLGLRDLVLLTSLPGAGKTTLAIQMALGVCQHCEQNDAVVVFLSLEMDKSTILNRISCNLGRLSYRTLLFGSTDLQHVNQQRMEQGETLVDLDDTEDRATWFTEDDQSRLDRIQAGRHEYQLDRRFVLCDRGDLDANDFLGQVVRLAREAKETASASRVLVVVDYLQVIPVPAAIEKQGDLSADRYRVQLLQDVLGRINEGAMPSSVLAISEARKPNKKTDAWGGSMAEVMGSARLGYAASAVLLYKPMTDDDLARHYPQLTQSQARDYVESRGVAPVELQLTKGRDGTQRANWGIEFHYHESRFSELHCPPTDCVRSTAVREQTRSQSSEEQTERRSQPRRRARRKKSARPPVKKSVKKKRSS